jgi:hypothetical protein
MTLASVKEILILSHREPRVSVHRRNDDGSWSVREVATGETVAVLAGTVTLDVTALYARGLEGS